MWKLDTKKINDLIIGLLTGSDTKGTKLFEKLLDIREEDRQPNRPRVLENLLESQLYQNIEKLTQDNKISKKWFENLDKNILEATLERINMTH